MAGDAADPAVRARALAGIERPFLVMANGPGQREAELGLVEAARRAGAAHVVKVSAPVGGPDVPVAIAALTGPGAAGPGAALGRWLAWRHGARPA